MNAVDHRLILLAKHVLPMLYRLPNIIADDAELRRFGSNPFGLRIGTTHGPAGVRVLDGLLMVPDPDADIHLVVEDADAEAPLAAYGGVAPRAARWTGNAICVQITSDSAGTLSRREFAEDALDNGNL